MNTEFLNFLFYKFSQYDVKTVFIVEDTFTIEELSVLSNRNINIIVGIENTFLRQKYDYQFRNSRNIIIGSFSKYIQYSFDAVINNKISEHIISELPKSNFYFSRFAITNELFLNYVKDTNYLVISNNYLNARKIKIGFAITTTSSRFEIVKKQIHYLKQILNNSYYDYIISVFCDEELNETTKDAYDSLVNEFDDVKFSIEYLKSVAKAKNRSIQPLIDYGCEYYFCLDDDTIIVDIKAIDYYIEACKDFHFLHLHLTGYLQDKEISPVVIKEYKNFTVESFSYDTGCLIIFDNEVLNKAGKWDERFEGWGYEHREFGERAERLVLNNQFHHLAIPKIYEDEYVIALDACFKIHLKEYKNYEDLTSLMKESNILYDRMETNINNLNLNEMLLNERKIDIVVPYVDSSDINWKKLFKEALSKLSNEKRKQYHLDSFEENNRRYLHNSLFKYFFRSISKFTPWINNVFLIVQSETQIPKWINRETVKIVYHKDFIPSKFLPTFNANTIESFLHRIPNLNEKFIYANDDLIFNRYLSEDEFFDCSNPKNGFYKKYDLNTLEPYLDVDENTEESYKYCFKNSYILSYNLFKNVVFREENERICKYHSFTAFKKSNYEHYYNEIEDYIMSNTTPFRNPSNINQYYFALCFAFETNFKYLLNSNIEYDFLKMFNLQSIDSQVACINCLYSNNDTPTICLNNYKNDNTLIKKLLDRKFPEKSKYEV